MVVDRDGQRGMIMISETRLCCPSAGSVEKTSFV
jgi:hypothetical protein